MWAWRLVQAGGSRAGRACCLRASLSILRGLAPRRRNAPPSFDAPARPWQISVSFSIHPGWTVVALWRLSVHRRLATVQCACICSHADTCFSGFGGLGSRYRG
jgi:hypothetical protein